MAGALDEVRAAGRWRRPRDLEPTGAVTGVLTDGGARREVVSFASNDYLGLTHHPTVVAAAAEAAERFGTGTGASRLVVGSRPLHGELEGELADWKGTEDALLFPTGYHANLGVLTTLAGPGVTVLSDELNHASIVDGCRLAKATVRVFRHGDLDQVDAMLAAVAGPALVVTDSAFSMDGDVADLEGLTTVCSWYGALLVLDEAHAVLGPNVPVRATGAAVRSRHDAPLLRMGTLSKTLGSLGGFVAGPRPYVDLLRNRARSFIFTTASTPADTAAGLAALRVVRSADGAGLVARLRHHVDRVAPGHPTPILPVVLGDEAAALDGSARLLSRGLLVPAIRPPTVPPGTSRLRVALSAAHTDEQVDRLLAGLAEVGYRPPIGAGPASAPVARPVRVAPAPLADATRPGARPAAPFAARSPRDVPGGMTAAAAGDAPDGVDGVDAIDGVPGDVAREVADLAAAGAPAGARVVRLASGRVGDDVAPIEGRPAGPLNGNGNGADGGPAGGGEPT